MAWWQWYLALSFVIGLVWATYEWFYCYDKGSRPEESDHDIEDAIEKGHIQREVFGDRTLLHPKDEEGHLLMEATNFTSYLEHKQKTLFFIIGVFYCTVAWPYELYNYARYRFFSAD